MVGVDPQGHLVLADRFLCAALLPVGHAEAEMRFSIVEVDPQRHLKFPDRLIRAALFPVGYA